MVKLFSKDMDDLKSVQMMPRSNTTYLHVFGKKMGAEKYLPFFEVEKT